jgi:hypothetical protein
VFPKVRLVPVKAEGRGHGRAVLAAANPNCARQRIRAENEAAVNAEREALKLIYLESCLVVHPVEADPQWGGQVERLIEEHGGSTFATSPFVRLECFGDPLSQEDFERAAASVSDAMVGLPFTDDVAEVLSDLTA